MNNIPKQEVMILGDFNGRIDKEDLLGLLQSFLAIS